MLVAIENRKVSDIPCRRIMLHVDEPPRCRKLYDFFAGLFRNGTGFRSTFLMDCR